MTEMHLGNALAVLGERTYREALKERTKEAGRAVAA
jgi:hypothetical protein